MRRLPRLLVSSMVLLGATGAARATDIPITGLKLIVVDKTVLASKAKAVFVAKDPAVTKGAGTDPAQIEATLAVVVYLVGRWTPALAVANAVLALAFAVPALILLSQGQLLNPEFFPAVVGEDGAEVAAIVSTVFGFGIAILAIWDIVDVIRKTIRSRH